VRLRGLSEEQILQRLDDRFSLLTGGSRAALPRQRTLRAAIDWTFDLCSAEEQALWTRLSAFAGGFDLEAAEAVCAGDGIARDSVIDLVAGLVDKSVLVREDGAWARYRLPETVRQYGKDQLVETGWLTAMRVRHRDYYQRLAAQADADWFSPRQVDWSARMHLEHANERVALDFSLTEPGHARAGLEITVSLWNFWAAAGYLREGRDWLDRALALNPEPTPARARALGASSFLALLLGKLDSASRTLAECRELASELGDPSGLAYAALFSGFTAMYRGDLQAALTLLEDALERHRANADLVGTWITLHELAHTASQAGDPRAVAFAEESLALCEAHGAQSCRSYALWMLGFEVWRRGDAGRAAVLMRKATELKRASNDQWGIASCVEVLAWAAAAEGDGEHAARLLGAAQKLWHAIGTSPAGIQHLVAGHAQCEREARQAVGDPVFMAAFREGADFTVDQVVAYALGEQAGTGPAMPARDSTAALTRRERQIAELIARGLSNKDIAATLMIAVRTAETHVEHVLAKLGFTSRTQIATWVAQRRDQAGGPESGS
jgi:DNA-binding CsgD family transcriptional regulator/tetratricopeptide (TPR) repeat protein